MSKSFNFNDFRRGRFFRYAPLILWIGVVLFASTGSAAMSETSRFVRPFLEFIFPNAPEETLAIYHAYIRKLAHLTEYGILGFLASFAFANSPTPSLRKFWFLCAFGVAALVAVIDETNQSFNAARTGSVYDVLLDWTGAIIAIFFFALIKRFFEKRRARKI